MSCLFNSYDPYFKQPFGAVRAGQTVHLSLCIPEELGYVDPHLVIQKEGKYDVPVHYRMKFDGQTPKQNHFSVDITLGDVGLYFYYFDLYTDFRRIYRDAGGEGVTARELVEEARRVARGYTGGSRLSRAWRELNPLVYTLIGAGSIGLVWLIVTLI